jgi:hypothetical protein
MQWEREAEVRDLGYTLVKPLRPFRENRARRARTLRHRQRPASPVAGRCADR